MGSQQQESTTPKELRDRMRTPQFAYAYANEKFNFSIDLCADAESSKCHMFFDETIDGLKQDWHKYGNSGWCNPPYSNVKPWLEKAYRESFEGFTTVFLLPTPNGEDAYRDLVFGYAAQIEFINGRLSFIAPEDFTVKGKKGKPDKHYKKGDEVKGNTRGSCFIVFRPYGNYDSSIDTYWVNRDYMKEQFYG